MNGGDDWQGATIEGLFSAANQPQYGLSLNLGGDVQSNAPSRSSMLEFQTLDLSRMHLLPSPA